MKKGRSVALVEKKQIRSDAAAHRLVYVLPLLPKDERLIFNPFFLYV